MQSQRAGDRNALTVFVFVVAYIYIYSLFPCAMESYG